MKYFLSFLNNMINRAQEDKGQKHKWVKFYLIFYFCVFLEVNPKSVMDFKQKN